MGFLSRGLRVPELLRERLSAARGALPRHSLALREARGAPTEPAPSGADRLKGPEAAGRPAKPPKPNAPPAKPAGAVKPQRAPRPGGAAKPLEAAAAGSQGFEACAVGEAQAESNEAGSEPDTTAEEKPKPSYQSTARRRAIQAGRHRCPEPEEAHLLDLRVAGWTGRRLLRGSPRAPRSRLDRRTLAPVLLAGRRHPTRGSRGSRDPR